MTKIEAKLEVSLSGTQDHAYQITGSGIQGRVYKSLQQETGGSKGGVSLTPKNAVSTDHQTLKEKNRDYA